MENSSKTLKTVLEAGTDFMGGKGIEQPRLICELLAARLLQCKRLELYLRFDAVLSDKQLAAMRRGVKRVAEGEPVQYVLGETEFMGHIFKTDRRALIPRPETELLVESVLACETIWTQERPVILDVGTGTGCIVISLALARPEALYLAVDVSSDALALAGENAKAHGVADKVAFSDRELSDLTDPETVDVVVSNPPYIPTAQYLELPIHIRDHEPRMALDGGETGLAVLESVVQDAVMLLKPGGRLFLEIGAEQGAAVKELLEQAGFMGVAVKKDLADHDRIVCAQLGS